MTDQQTRLLLRKGRMALARAGFARGSEELQGLEKIGRLLRSDLPTQSAHNSARGSILSVLTKRLSILRASVSSQSSDAVVLADFYEVLDDFERFVNAEVQLLR